MKKACLKKRKQSLQINVPGNNQRAYRLAICVAALSCGGAFAQTNSPPADSAASTNVTELPNVTVVGRLDQARSQIQPDLGATATTFTSQQIQNISQGADAPFNEVILRAPGVAQD